MINNIWILILLLLAGCVANPLVHISPESGLSLPGDADRSRLPEQRELASRGCDYDQKGNLKTLPAEYPRPTMTKPILHHSPPETGTQAPVSTSEPRSAAQPVTSCGLLLESHRGVQEYPENSIQGVTAAYNQGFSGAETDAQMTVDGSWVLHHDPVLGRTVDAAQYYGQGTSHISSNAFTRMRLKDRSGKPTQYRAPTVSQLAAAVAKSAAPGQYLNIEVKGHYTCPSIQSLHSAVMQHLSPNQIRYSSVDMATLRCLRTISADVYLGYIHAPDTESLKVRMGRTSSHMQHLAQVAAGRNFEQEATKNK